ncbi:MAG: sensor domain-containing diguanylate cyclase [Planctomycetota bacterium]|nr:MAG: sensor domain-containing diguanylate cyclase [Planctomycetota bacterium]
MSSTVPTGPLPSCSRRSTTPVFPNQRCVRASSRYAPATTSAGKVGSSSSSFSSRRIMRCGRRARLRTRAGARIVQRPHARHDARGDSWIRVRNYLSLPMRKRCEAAYRRLACSCDRTSERSSAPSRRPERDRVPRRPTMRSIHTLLVDDAVAGESELQRRLTSKRDAAFLIEHLQTLSAAVSRLQGGEIDVVLLALQLSEASIVAAVGRLRDAAPNVPVVVVTDTNGNGAHENAPGARAEEYVSKRSASRTVLRRALKEAFERHRVRVAADAESRAQRREDEQFRGLVVDGAAGLIVYSRDGEVLFSNRSALRLAERAQRRLHAAVLGRPFPHGATFELEVGRERVVEVRISVCEWDGKPCWAASLFDISAHKRAQVASECAGERLRDDNARLRRLASTDPLTELSNRRGLELELAREVGSMRRTGASLAAVLLDCDDFKLVNAALGHAGGDAVLKELGARLSGSLRPSDHLGRIGGDEFLVLLPDTRMAEALYVAERLRLAVSDPPMRTATGALSVSASFGVEMVSHECASIDAVVVRTEAALQRSKRRGKNCSSTQDDGALGAAEGAAALLQALQDRRAYRVQRQRIVRLDDASIVGWTLVPCGPAGTFESRRDFLALARERGIHTSIDLGCLRACVDDARGLQQFSSAHVQVLPSTLLETPCSELLEVFAPALTDVVFCVEISEQQWIGEATRLRDPVRALKGAGIRVAVRDVGFGGSSLETLILLEPDVVLFDAQLVQGSAKDPGRARSLRRMANAVAALGSSILAEGVDAREDLELMLALGVAYGQGSLWESDASAQTANETVPLTRVRAPTRGS